MGKVVISESRKGVGLYGYMPRASACRHTPVNCLGDLSTDRPGTSVPGQCKDVPVLWGLADLANKNRGHPVKFEFQIRNK